MKKWWIVLAAVLAIAAAAVVGYMLSTAPRGVESLQATQPETAAPTEPATERPTEPPTEAPTEPPMEAGETLILNGTELVTAVSDGTEYVSADALQQAGLSLPEAEPLQNGGMDYYVLSAVSEENRCAEYVDEEVGLRYLTPGAARFSIEQSVNVPVLMYHAVSDNMWGIDELFVSPASMEEQLRYLVDNGYEPIWFSDLAELEQYEKPVILTFDDGYDDNYTELLPLLRKYNVKATVFMIADAMGMQHKMTEEQVREMADSGLVSIQSHGLTHADMDAMDEETLIRELGESQRILTRVTGRQPSVLCYPTGRYSDLTLEVAERYYNFGLKMVGGQYNTADDPFLVSRYYVSRYTGLDSFAAMVAPAGT